MSNKISPFVENISEATVACLITMAQGNVLTIGVSHLIIASQTGFTAGAVATIAIILSKTHRRGLIALILGVDRLLDMLRTVTNITGDATVATVVAHAEGQLSPPNLSEDADKIVSHR